MVSGLPNDPIFDPVGIVVWAIDAGLYDLMYSAWGWPIAEIVHFTGLCLLIGAVGMFDLRMVGLVRGISLPALHKLVPFGVLGFVLSAGSGFLFVVTSPDQYLYNPAWQVKMALLALAGLNMVLFYLTTSRRLAAELDRRDLRRPRDHGLPPAELVLVRVVRMKVGRSSPFLGGFD